MYNDAWQTVQAEGEDREDPVETFTCSIPEEEPEQTPEPGPLQRRKALFAPGYWNRYDGNLSWAERVMSILPKYNVPQPYLFYEQGTPQWAAARRAGSSEFADMANAQSAYESRASLWYRKVNNIPKKVNFAMELGAEREEYARTEFVNKFDAFGQFYDVGMFICDVDPRLSCSPDGLWWDARTEKTWVVEFKCPMNLPYTDIPNHHRAQLLGNMAIIKVPRALYCVWTKDHEMVIWACEFDLEAWIDLYAEVDVFLKAVESKTPLPKPKRGTKMEIRLPRSRNLSLVIPGCEIKPLNVRSYYCVTGLHPRADCNPTMPYSRQTPPCYGPRGFPDPTPANKPTV